MSNPELALGITIMLGYKLMLPVYRQKQSSLLTAPCF